MSSLYNVSTDIQSIFDNISGESWLLYNSGNSTLYVSEYGSPSATNGFPIAPKGTLHWDGARNALYAVAASGTTGLYVTRAATDQFSATDLAQLIASDLTGGTQLTNSGIAQAIYDLGTPTVDKPTELLSITTIVQSPGLSSTLCFGVNATNYKCLRIRHSTSSATSGATLFVNQVVVNWYNDVSGAYPVGTSAYHVAASGQDAYVSLRVQGAYFAIVAQGNTTNLATVSHTIQVIGSMRDATADNMYFRNSVLEDSSRFDHALNGVSGLTRINFSAPASASTPTYIAGYSGRCNISAYFPVGTYPWTMYIRTLDGITLHLFNNATAFLNATEVILPLAPVCVTVNNATATATTFTCTVISEGISR